jgi:hypothetical protein
LVPWWFNPQHPTLNTYPEGNASGATIEQDAGIVDISCCLLTRVDNTGRFEYD